MSSGDCMFPKVGLGTEVHSFTRHQKVDWTQTVAFRPVGTYLLGPRGIADAQRPGERQHLVFTRPLTTSDSFTCNGKRALQLRSRGDFHE